MNLFMPHFSLPSLAHHHALPLFPPLIPRPPSRFFSRCIELSTSTFPQAIPARAVASQPRAEDRIIEKTNSGSYIQGKMQDL